ncbi:MAG: 3-dehydroquinate synthase [Coriobacteriia bacterium]|nr:3-dehydroquinate synthase [Coriobacteriia bacterium]
MSHVFLIGFMGAGKSTVGPLVAERLGRPFIDLDEVVAGQQGREIVEIFEGDGEAAFRAFELEALGSIADRCDSVVACGGGLVTMPTSVTRMRKLGTVVHLVTTADEALKRIADPSTRPLLAGENPELAARSLLDSRRELYAAAADYEVDTVGRPIAEVVDEVVLRVASAPRRGRPVVVPVKVGEMPYEVVIGPGVLEDAGALLRIGAPTAGRIALVTDTTVGDLFGLTVERKLIEEGYAVHPLAVAPGEDSKNWAVAGEILEALAELRFERTDFVVALGGGVVGDLAGFVAATYLRGIGFAQVPTTLLAQVDSSVGGKTGVDLKAGKNLAGAFKQPTIVIADTNTLELLPQSEWRSGTAEVAKSAVVDGEEFFSWLEAAAERFVSRDERTIIEAVSRCVRFKASVVSADETEVGPRECLNYGHTLGHAIEKVAGYGAVPHGIAVAEGMRFAARLSVEVSGGSREFVARQDAILDTLGLGAMTEALDPQLVLEAMHSDKKARGGTVRFVLVEAPGTWRCEPIADAVIAEHLDAWLESKVRRTP